MINASELQRFNFVNHIHPDTTLPAVMVKVLTVHKDKISYMYPSLEHRVEAFEDDLAEIGEGYIPFAELQAIQLSNEWLTKAGLDISGNTVSVKDNERLTFTWDGNALLTGNEPIQYLHQLQNAVQNITGTVLEIDLKA